MIVKTGNLQKLNTTDLMEMVKEADLQHQQFELNVGWRNKILAIKRFHAETFKLKTELEYYSKAITKHVKRKFPHLKLALQLKAYVEENRFHVDCHICRESFVVDRARLANRELSGQKLYDHYMISHKNGNQAASPTTTNQENGTWSINEE